MLIMIISTLIDFNSNLETSQQMDAAQGTFEK